MQQVKLLIKRALRSVGLDVRRSRPSQQAGETTLLLPNIRPNPPKPYIERPEYGPSNIETKLENVKSGEPFEYPDVLNLNQAVMKLAQGYKRIVELGSGTGYFAHGMAVNPDVHITASEFDYKTCEWARTHRSRPNIHYVCGPVPQELAPFDALVSIEVIEHLHDFSAFLSTCKSMAPVAIITTPNRARSRETYHCGPPEYFKHVREWTAGEFYWVLRCFFLDVELYAMTSQEDPNFERVCVDDQRSALIAVCKN